MDDQSLPIGLSAISWCYAWYVKSTMLVTLNGKYFTMQVPICY